MRDDLLHVRVYVCVRTWMFANSFAATTFTNILYNLWILILLASLRADKFNLLPFVLAAILLQIYLYLYKCVWVYVQCTYMYNSYVPFVVCSIFRVLYRFHVARQLFQRAFYINKKQFYISNSNEILLDNWISQFAFSLLVFFSFDFIPTELYEISGLFTFFVIYD